MPSGSGRSSRSPTVKAASGGRQQRMGPARPPPGSAAILECPSAASPWRQRRGSGLRQWAGGAGGADAFDWTRCREGLRGGGGGAGGPEPQERDRGPPQAPLEPPLNHSPSATSTWSLNASTTSPDSPFQCSTTLPV